MSGSKLARELYGKNVKIFGIVLYFANSPASLGTLNDGRGGQIASETVRWPSRFRDSRCSEVLNTVWG